MKNLVKNNWLYLALIISIVLWILLFLEIKYWWYPDIKPNELGDTFGTVNSFVSMLTLILVWFTFYNQKSELKEQSESIKNQNFRNTLHSMLSWLKDALTNISWIWQNPLGQRSILFWKEVFLSLDAGQIIIQNWQLCWIDKSKWLNHWWEESIENIIFIIWQIEDYIEASKASPNRKDFYLSLLKSYLWLSERRIIWEILKKKEITLKSFE